MKTKKKLLIPIALLVLAVMAVTSTTFAWFTTNNVATGKITNAKVSATETMLYIVNDFGHNVTPSKTQLETEANWGVTSTRAYADNTNILKMVDVTYVLPGEVATVTAGNEGLYRQGVYTAADAAAANDLKATTSEYIDITYTFWCSDDTVNTYDLVFNFDDSAITSAGKTRTFNVSDYNYFTNAFDAVPESAPGADDAYYTIKTGWNDVVAFYGTQTEPVGYTDTKFYTSSAHTSAWYFDWSRGYNTDAANATRVMFTDITQSTDNSSTTTVGNIIGVWEPNSLDGYDAQTTPGTRDYPFDVQDMYGKAQLGDFTPPAAVNNKYNAGTTPKLIDTTNPLVTTEKLTTFVTNDFDKLHSSGTTYFRAQVNLKVWIEGWDSDCFNVILDDVLAMDFRFEAVKQ